MSYSRLGEHVESVDRKTWAGKFSLLSPWFLDIITSVKKDCKSEHLRLDQQFVRQHFSGMPVHRISLDEMRTVYLQQILSGRNELAEFVANRWLFRNMELYRFFAETLEKMFSEFDKIEELPQQQSEELIKGALEKFDCERVFAFVVLNDVAVPETVFSQLQKKALEALSQRPPRLDDDEPSLRNEMERLKERHEKKIQEMTKKHAQELQRLHREISQLKADIEKRNAELSCVE